MINSGEPEARRCLFGDLLHPDKEPRLDIRIFEYQLQVLMLNSNAHPSVLLA